MTTSTADPGTSADAARRCPRCDYDQTGAAQAWTDRCPLVSACSECGFEIEWRLVYTEPRHMRPWFIERRVFAWPLPFQIIATLTVTLLRPWTLWRSCRLSDPPRWGRVVLLLGLLLAAIYASMSTVTAVRIWRVTQESRVMGAAMTPAPVVVGLRAALLPLSSRPPGMLLLASGQTQGIVVSGWRSFSDVGVVAALAWVHHTLALVTFVVLPQTRRRAKVRWRHFGRLYAYGLAGGAICAIAAVFSPFIGLLFIALHAFAFQFIWWTAGSARYLALEAPWIVGAAVWGIGLGATPIVLGLLASLLGA